MRVGGRSVHMGSMTETLIKPATRTFDASIASVFEFHGRRTIVMLRGNNWISSIVPLTDVTVTLREGEFFMASNGKGETHYFSDLSDAWRFTRDNGSAGCPDAIVILTPTVGKNGISEMVVVRVHERAVAVVAR